MNFLSKKKFIGALNLKRGAIKIHIHPFITIIIKHRRDPAVKCTTLSFHSVPQGTLMKATRGTVAKNRLNSNFSDFRRQHRLTTEPLTSGSYEGRAFTEYIDRRVLIIPNTSCTFGKLCFFNSVLKASQIHVTSNHYQSELPNTFGKQFIAPLYSHFHIIVPQR